MNTKDLVQFFTTETPPRHKPTQPTLAPSRHELASPVRSAIVRARQVLIGEQRLDGSWAGRRTVDISSLPHLLLLDAFLRRERSEFADRAVRELLNAQLSAGGWALNPGGLFDLDQSVLAYFALKLSGECAVQSDMARARQSIVAQGGADACSARTRLWLGVLGQVAFEYCAPIAPETLLTAACGAAADELLLAALSVVWTLRPRREVELSHGMRELFIEQPQHWKSRQCYLPQQSSPALAGFWTGCDRIGFVPLRRRAMDRANFLLTEAAAELPDGEQTVEQFVWQRIALDALGHTASSRVIAACEVRHAALAGTETDEARTNLETCLTADTTAAIEALAASGMSGNDFTNSQGIHWLATHRLGPARKNPRSQEIAAVLNAFTCDARCSASDAWLPPSLHVTNDSDAYADADEFSGEVETSVRPTPELCESLLHDCCALQHADGGWCAGESLNNTARGRGLLRSQFTRTARASEPEATGTMLELIARQPSFVRSRSLEAGIEFIRNCQRGDGSWHAENGSRRVQSTASAVRGLLAAGVEPSDPTVATGVQSLLIQQQISGGWGEPHCSTANETAIAVIALVAAGLADHEATRRGVRFLVDCQCETGTWGESPQMSGAVEGGSTLRNDLQSTATALLALARWTVSIGAQNHADEPTQLRLVCNDVPW